MSKAILVIDMPQSCDVCDFVDDSEAGKMWCGLPTFGYEVTDCIACRPEDCPLKDLPQKQTIHCTDPTFQRFAKTGWNSCINEILRDSEV